MRRPRLQRTRLATRLVALVLVPLAALGWQFAGRAAERSAAAGQASEIESGADRLVRVVALGAAIVKERVPTSLALATQVRGEGIPVVDRATMSTATGIDIDGQLRTTRAATDAAAAKLSAESWLEGVLARLASIRGDVDGGTTYTADGAGAVLRSLRDAQQLVENRALDSIAQLTHQVTATEAADDTLAADLRAEQVAYQLTIAYADLGSSAVALSGIEGFEGGLTSTQFVSAADSPRISLALANAWYRSLDRELLRTATDTVLARYRTVRESPSAVRTDGFLTSFVALVGSRDLAGDDLGLGFDYATYLIRTFLPAGLQYQDALNEVVSAAGRQVVQHAQDARGQAEDAYRYALAQGVIALLLALLGAWLLSRGVTRPLGLLAHRARQISAGRLERDGGAGGPREVVAVSQAFDDVVENLVLVQAQAAALSAGATSDPVLSRRAPGPLGEAIQASVEHLSGSLQAREQLEAQLRHETTHDGLTGLLNRSAALVALQQTLARINRTAGGLGVVQVNIDRTRVVNELAGQAAGDRMLREAARVISACVRDGDVVARLGSDEFAVVAETASIDVLVELSQRIVDALGAVPLRQVAGAHGAAGLPESIGASIGVAVAFDGVQDAAAVLEDAGTAVRAAKQHGSGWIEILDDELREQRDRRNRITAGLREALANGDLRLQYQPIVDMAGRVTGVEALCRWFDPVLGDVPPAVFVEAAEASDLVLDLDRWVLGEATRQVAEWDREGRHPGVYISVNVSGRHLHGHDLVGDVVAALDRSGIAPDRLLLEVTETVLLDDLDAAAGQLTTLRELGVRVAVDDFGTGYTSISQLQKLPVDVVKIDRSFVVGMSRARGESLVRLMIDMAGILGLNVVAEGVETPGELEQLREMGCPLVQGFLLGRPAPPDDVTDVAPAVPSAATPTGLLPTHPPPRP